MNELKITNLGNNSNKVYHIWATNMFKILGTKGLTYLGPLGYNSQNWMDNLPAGTQIPALPSKPARPESTNKLGIALFSQESKMWEQRCQDEMDIRNLLEPSLGDVVTLELADDQPMLGLSNVSTAAIIAHVRNKHSKLQSNDIAALDKRCNSMSRPDQLHGACSQPDSQLQETRSIRSRAMRLQPDGNTYQDGEPYPRNQ